MTERAEQTASDAEVLERIRSGDRDAYMILVQRYHSRLRSVLSFYCASSTAVEEYIQDAFVQAYVKLDRFDRQRPFLPWLKAIALNNLKDELRRCKAVSSAQEGYLRYLQLARLDQDPDALQAEARLNALDACLERLPRNQYEILHECYSRSRPLNEMAQQMQLKTSALKVRLLRLRRALRDCIALRLAAGEGGTRG